MIKRELKENLSALGKKNLEPFLFEKNKGKIFHSFFIGKNFLFEIAFSPRKGYMRKIK